MTTAKRAAAAICACAMLFGGGILPEGSLPANVTFGVNAYAADSFTFEGITYNIDAQNGTAEVAKQSSGSIGQEVSIPQELTYNGSRVKVTAIGSKAFYNCTSLRKITLPSGIVSIGTSAFNGCTDLTEIDIPDSVAEIGDNAFYNCRSLAKVSLPSNISAIGKRQFQYCESLEEITVPSSVKTIGDYAFESCKSLKSAVISDGTEIIGENAFANCSLLEKVVLSKELSEIGKYAFAYCEKLTYVSLPEKLASLGNYAFSNCYLLEAITIPDSVTAIKSGTFFQCSSLKSITIPPYATTVGINALKDCSALETVYVPKGVSISSAGVRKAARVIYYTVNGTAAITGAEYGSANADTELTIPEMIGERAVLAVVDSAFKDWGFLTRVIIPAGTDISDAAFPAESDKIYYAKNPDNTVTITAIIPSVNSAAVSIPETIDGYTIISVADEYRQYVGVHTHIGGEATCTSQAVCDLCGDGYGENKAHTLTEHSATEATCTEAGNKQYRECSVCNNLFSDENGAEETTKEAITIAAKGHKLTKTETVASDCTTSGKQEYYTCESCGKYFSDANGENEITNLDDYGITEPNDHSFGNWQYDKTEHYKVCTECDTKVDTAPHSFDEGKVTTEPTETTDGVTTYTCEVCGYQKTEPIEKLEPTEPEGPTEAEKTAEEITKLPDTITVTNETTTEDIEKLIEETTGDDVTAAIESTVITPAAEGVEGKIEVIVSVTDSDGNKEKVTITFVIPALPEKLPDPVVYYPIFTSAGVSADMTTAAVGETVNVRTEFGYDIIVTANGSVIAKIDQSGSFTMPTGNVHITRVMNESLILIESAWRHSYVYSYDGDMNKIKVNSDIREKGIIIVNLGKDYANEDFTIYSGRKNTSKKITTGALDENGRFTFEADEGKNYTLVIE